MVKNDENVFSYHSPAPQLNEIDFENSKQDNCKGYPQAYSRVLAQRPYLANPSGSLVQIQEEKVSEQILPQRQEAHNCLRQRWPQVLARQTVPILLYLGVEPGASCQTTALKLNLSVTLKRTMLICTLVSDNVDWTLTGMHVACQCKQGSLADFASERLLQFSFTVQSFF